MEREELIYDFLNQGWAFPEHIWNCISDYEQSFLIGEFAGKGRGLNNYLERINYLGFDKMENVLDAGCGYGQWSIAMSHSNQQVIGVDINMTRLLGATEISKAMSIKNTKFQFASLENLPFPSNYFDGIFCYSVFMFTQMPKTLLEFNRVLKPCGKLYINTDSIGWYIHLLKDVKRDRFSALKMIAKTILGKTQGIVVTESWLKKQLAKANFDVVDLASEGETTFIPNNNQTKPIAFYPKEYYGKRAVLEVICKKR